LYPLKSPFQRLISPMAYSVSRNRKGAGLENRLQFPSKNKINFF
jgi:hypothetical protein